MRTSALTLALAGCLLAGHVDADTILLDFGSTAYTGADAPGHEDGLATGTTWNAITGDTASGLLDEDGNPVVGVALDFGTGVVSSIDYTGAVQALTVDHAAYPHWNDALGQDHLVRNGDDPAIALAVTGLAPGTYDFYLTGFRGDGSTNAGRDYDVRYRLSTAPVTDFSSDTGATLTTLNNDDPANVDNWIPGDNYITDRFTVTAAGEDLYLYSNSAGFIGVMSSLEIIEVPEPASVGLLAAGLTLLLPRRRDSR
jgi:hypothetical protein